MSISKKEFLNKTKEEFYREIKKYQSTLKPTKELEGFASSAIVGEKNYPQLKIHNISNEEKENSFFNTGDIVKRDYSQVIKLKAKNILGSTEQTHIRKNNTKITEELRDIYKSKKPIEFTSAFEDELKFNKVYANRISGIIGSKNPLKSISANSNTSTSTSIEKYTAEDIKSREAIINLYEKGINEHQIINLLATGSFGININRKLVPTRWAISAYDQTIEKHIHKKIIKNRPIEKIEIYTAKDKGNEFLIILIPDTFKAQVIEKFSGGLEMDYVDFDNKLHKKEPETAGGFYATKIAVFEHLQERKKQASIISIRVIEDYDIPLGVVFVRETVRVAMKNKIFTSNDMKDTTDFIKYKFPKHHQYFISSKVLEEKRKQRKISEFFK